MKYIIEIAKEYEEYFKGILICGIAEGKFAVDVIAKEDLEELNSDYINEHFGELQDDAYERGHGIGYQKGFEDGKEVYDKGCVGCKFEGNGKDHSPCDYCCNGYSNQYQTKQADDEIKVGDEVYCKGDDESDSGVTTWVGKARACVMWQDGSAGEVEKDELIKTNRHFDISSILKEMQS